MYSRHTPLLLSICLLLAACQGPIKQPASSLAVDASIIGAPETSQSSSRDAYGKTEVISANASKGSLAVALISTNTMGVIAESAQASRLLLKGWQPLKGKELIFGKTGKVGGVAFERFSHGTNSCFHFHKAAHRSAADDRGRFRQLVTGYVCDSGQGAFKTSEIESFVAAISAPLNAASNYRQEARPVTVFDPVLPLRARMFMEPPDPTN